MTSPMENNTKYHNWIKRSLALLYLKEGIAEEINQKATDLHNKIKKDVSRNCPSAFTSTCQAKCTSKSFQKTNHNTRWTINCASNVCNYWLDELIKIHEHQPCPDVKWVNCDPTLWPSQPWEVAKVFQPIGCATHRNAEDSDIAALLTFMLNCTFFDNQILPNKVSILKELKEIRNFTMHSATLEVEDADMVTSLDKMIALLEDPTHFGPLPACKTAADKIRELKSKPMTMSFSEDDEQKALSQRVASLTGEVKSICQTTDKMRDEIDAIREQNLDEMKQKITSASTDIDKLKKETKTLTATLESLNVPHLQSKLPELDRQLIETSRQFGELRTKFEDRIGVLECGMAQAKLGLSQVQERSAKNTETIQHNTETIQQNTEAIKHVESKIGSMESELSSVQQKLNTQRKLTGMDNIIVHLMSMGFEIQECQDAINFGKNTVESAVEWLVSGKPGFNPSAEAGGAPGPILRLRPAGSEFETRQFPYQKLKPIPAGASASSPSPSQSQSQTSKPADQSESFSGEMDQSEAPVVSRLHLDDKLRKQKDGFEQKKRDKARKQAMLEKLRQKKAGSEFETGQFPYQKLNPIPAGASDSSSSPSQSQSQTSKPADQSESFSGEMDQSEAPVVSRLHLDDKLRKQKDGFEQKKRDKARKQAMLEKLRQKKTPSVELDDDVTNTKRHLIDLYKENCMKVPIYPLKEEMNDFVENIFVLPNLVEMDTHGVKISNGQNRNESKKTECIDIRGIFYAGEELQRDIYLVAEGGTGKSTLCEFLVHLWVKDHSKMEGDSDETRDKSVVKYFDLLFYISLRDAQGSCIWDIENMIKDQLDLENIDVSKLILNNTCLIILDGLDEYSLEHKKGQRFISEKLPWKPKHKCTILTTSRPWKMIELAREKGFKIDRQIRITGLESQSQKDLAKNVMKKLNDIKKQNKQVDDFICYMEKQKLDKHMETPILLIQMLGLWFDGISFGKSQCEIYSKMIEKQIEFAVKVKKIEPLSLTQRSSAAPSEDKHQSAQLPACLSGHADQKDQYCQKYQRLLLKISKIAYHFLFGRQESALVFDQDQMEIMGLSSGEINQCLHLGLLTQYKVLDKITQRQKSVSFVHKSHQEFFAAVYLWQTGLGPELKKLLEGSFTHLDRAVQVEKVILFTAGMNPEISREIAEVIMTVASSDSRIKEYRESCLASYDAPGTTLVKQIQGVILAAIEESRNNGLTIPAIPLQDIWMDGYGDRDFPPGRVLACTQHLQLHHVRSLYIKSPSDIPRDVIWQLVKDCSPHLTKLVLKEFLIYASMLEEFVETTSGGLQTLGLYYHNGLNLSPVDEATLTKIVSPQSLGLSYVKMSHEQLEFVYKHLAQWRHTQVVLEELRCNLHDHRSDHSCEIGLDMSTSRQLNTLILRDVSVGEVKFQPDSLLHCEIRKLSAAASAVRSLRDARSLHTFVCHSDRHSVEVIQELVTSLPQLDTLRKITLNCIDMTCTQQRVFPDHMKALEIINLNYVELRATQLRELLAALPSHRVAVDLYNVIITDYDRNDDIIQQTADSQRTKVVPGPRVTYKQDECVVSSLYFYHTK